MVTLDNYKNWRQTGRGTLHLSSGDAEESTVNSRSNSCRDSKLVLLEFKSEALPPEASRPGSGPCPAR